MRVYFSVRCMRMFVSVLHQDVLSVYCATQVSVLYGSVFHTATHCNTLQHTATHCNTLQHTATHCNTLQHTVFHIQCALHEGALECVARVCAAVCRMWVY